MISILGSTGSIGRQTLDVCRDIGMRVNAISAGSNIDLLEKQAREFNVSLVSVYDPEKAKILKDRLTDTNITVLSGDEGNVEVAVYPESTTVITAMSGMIGLVPTIAAVKAGKRIGLANKETLVCGGHVIMPLSKKFNCEIIPVDSEHSAIFQCLQGRNNNFIRKIILTASGGPFFGYNHSQLANITVKDALKHPNWDMGAKITIDSASLMNKGLEMIEAKWLFNVSIDDIEVVVHRESIIHSAVEFDDNSIIAQLGVPQMYLPIKYALTYPKRVQSGSHQLSLFDKSLTFFHPDRQTFKCLDLAVLATKMGGLYPAIMNAANEQAVLLFLQEKISFNSIPDLISQSLEHINASDGDDVESIVSIDKETRKYVNDLVKA